MENLGLKGAYIDKLSILDIVSCGESDELKIMTESIQEDFAALNCYKMNLDGKPCPTQLYDKDEYKMGANYEEEN